MSYAIYYQYHVIGDVLLIKLSDLVATHYEKYDDLVVIFHEEEIIGYNIFEISQVIKIKVKGLIPLPGKELIDLVNHRLTKENLPKLPYLESSGFVVGKVLAVSPHPNSHHLHLTKVDLGQQIVDIVCGASNVRVNQLVVVASLNTFMFDGTLIRPGKLLGYPSNGMICSAYELNMEASKQTPGILVLEDNIPVGSDFFRIERGEQ